MVYNDPMIWRKKYQWLESRAFLRELLQNVEPVRQLRLSPPGTSAEGELTKVCFYKQRLVA